MSEAPQPPSEDAESGTDAPNPTPSAAMPEQVHSGWQTFGIIIITFLITLGVGYWAVATVLFPKAFTPVELSQKEKIVLEQKLEQLGVNSAPQKKLRKDLTPEPYSEVGASRDIFLTEKELNALVANNTNLASQLVIDLSDNLASVKLLIDMDPDFPIIGGKTLKITSGLELKISSDNPRVILKGVSLWGVPLPDAWLGNLKNVDLLQEFDKQGGFWQQMKNGIEEMTIEEGKLKIKLKK